MAKFNLGHKMIELVNKMFGSKIELTSNGEEKDEPTLFDEIKTSMETYVGDFQTQLTELKEKAEAHDTLQESVTALTAEVEKHKGEAETLTKKVGDMQKDFDKKLVDLRKEVRDELVKEKESGSTSGLSSIEDEKGLTRPKEIVADIWKDQNRVKASVGQ